MYKLRLSLLAVLCVSALNASDTLRVLDQGFNVLVRDPFGSAAAVYYVTKKAAIVDQMPECAHNLKKYGVDLAGGHVIQNGVKKAIDSTDKRTGNEIIVDAVADAGLSLAITNSKVLPAIWRVVNKMGLAPEKGSNLADAAETSLYSMAHGACRLAFNAARTYYLGQ